MQWWENPICKIFFNSHPHKEDDKAKRLNKLNRQFFNSHPHKEDDATDHWFDTAKDFSTHILTRRMTDPVYRLSDRKCFFNSHPHKEDDMFVECLVEDVSFSTHILTRRMTTLPDVPVLCLLFQLTSSQGG